MLVSLMVKIQRHTCILFYGGTILKQSFMNISPLHKKVPKDTRRQMSNSEPYYFPIITTQKPFTHEKPKLHLHGKCSFIFTSRLYVLSLVIYNDLQAKANRLNWGVKHSLKFMMPCRLVHKYQCFGTVCCHNDHPEDGGS